MAIVFGRVPHPASVERWILDNQNSAWNDLGQRKVLGVVWHRMVGGQDGTDGFFRAMANARQTGSGGLTDYGVGVAAQDGAAAAGRIYRWNDPLGLAHPGCSPNRAGWASGSWNAARAFGDGKAFVLDHGGDLNVINRDQVSIEISGLAMTPLDEASRGAVVALTAYWADQARIPWDVFPMVPGKGYSFVRWHEEFGPDEPDGSPKHCPFDVVKGETDALIARTKAILKQFQIGDAPEVVVNGQEDFVKFDQLRVFHVPQNAVATGRAKANRNAAIVKEFAAGSAIESDGFFHGESVDGKNKWIRTSGSPHPAIHQSGLVETI